MLCEVDCFGVMFSRMHGFMKKGAFTDVTFVVHGGSKIRAHKSVLAACSTVFEVMFQSSLIEGRRNEIEINDVNQEVLSAFLDYVYLRDAKIVKKHVNQLLMMADKYNVETLALVCDGYIEASLTAENAVDSLILADLFRRYDLRAKIGHFIKSNLEIISTYPSWAKLGGDFELMNALLHSFVQEQGAKVCSKLPNSVTWTIVRNEGDWYEKTEITPSKILTFNGSTNPEVHFAVKLTCSNYKIAVNICVMNSLGKQVSSVLVIRRSSISGVEAQTNIRSSWSPGIHSGLQILVPGMEDCCYIYPMFITVVVKMSDPSDQFQMIEKIVERNSRFSDAEIFTEDGGKFPVHKLVLSNYSEFFSKLFKDDQKLYKILGVDRKTIIHLLDYIYSHTNPSPKVVDLNLLKGAKQFQLDHLVEYCVSTLEDNIRHDNVVEICTTAEELGLERLVSAAMDFMGEKTGEIMKSAKWSTMKLHPKLIKQLLFKVKENSSENK
uniref:Speckle-type POZ protein-like protein n=2 Tax=Lygus hesperus TaxID=30085 RepID=A0A0A9YDA3_LYGHE